MILFDTHTENVLECMRSKEISLRGPRDTNMTTKLLRCNMKFARLTWGSELSPVSRQVLRAYTDQFQFSIANGDLLLLNRKWYITHAGLVRLAWRNRCRGTDV